MTLRELGLTYELEQAMLDMRQDAELLRREMERQPLRAMHRREMRRLTAGRTLSASERKLVSHVARANVSARVS